jgi:hypothetical protein
MSVNVVVNSNNLVWIICVVPEAELENHHRMDGVKYTANLQQEINRLCSQGVKHHWVVKSVWGIQTADLPSIDVPTAFLVGKELGEIYSCNH